MTKTQQEQQEQQQTQLYKRRRRGGGGACGVFLLGDLKSYPQTTATDTEKLTVG